MRPRNIVGSVALTGAALLAYAAWVEPRWLQLRRTRIRIEKLPAPLERLRIGLLTDLHADDSASVALAARAAGMLVAARPDLIALTGDFVTEGAPHFERVIAALGRLHAPLGVYAVPGNHDHAAGVRRLHGALDRAPNITDLTNRAKILEIAGARLCIAGIDDLNEGEPRLALPPPSARDLTILLAHTPDHAERLRHADAHVDLVLSGHTHGGQVRLPGLPAPMNSAVRSDLYEDGLQQRPWTRVYTSRGVGTVHLPFRFFARPEVTVLELTRFRPAPSRFDPARLRSAPRRVARRMACR
jgi:predicted MPP superfamily phosphohydrolase